MILKIKSSVVIITTIWIYFFTLTVHLLLIQFENARNFLGLTMFIPLFTVIIYQYMFKKIPIRHTFAIKKTKVSTIIICILLPLFLGFAMHLYFYLTSKGYFLFIDLHQLIPLLLIGISISSISAFLEEVVWRGNYHYYLRQRYNVWKTACITGVIWSLWHLPIAIFYKPYLHPSATITSYLLILFFISYILTFFREKEKSVFPVAILHGMLNVFYLSDGTKMKVSVDQLEMEKCILMAIIFLVMVLFLLKKSSYSDK